MKQIMTVVPTDQPARERIRDSSTRASASKRAQAPARRPRLSTEWSTTRTAQATRRRDRVVTFTPRPPSSRARPRGTGARARQRDRSGRAGTDRGCLDWALPRSHRDDPRIRSHAPARASVEAGLDPAFEVADALAAQLAFDAAYADFQTGLLDGSVPEVGTALNRGFGVEQIRALTEVVDRNRSILPLTLDLVSPVDLVGFVGRCGSLQPNSRRSSRRRHATRPFRRCSGSSRSPRAPRRRRVIPTGVSARSSGRRGCARAPGRRSGGTTRTTADERRRSSPSSATPPRQSRSRCALEAISRDSSRTRSGSCWSGRQSGVERCRRLRRPPRLGAQAPARRP